MKSITLENHLLIHSKMELVLPKLKDKSVGAIITDPPFGVRKDEHWDDKFHFLRMISYWLEECLRVAEHTVIWFGADKMMPYVMHNLIMTDRHEIFHRQHAWKKPEGSQMNGASNNNIWYSDECIWVFSNDWEKTKSFGKDMPYAFNDFGYRTMAKKTTGHPTAKPVPLMRQLVGRYTAPNDTVLDPFSGSFSTTIACIDMGRRSIGIEQSPLPDKPITDIDGDNPDYYNMGVARVKRHLDAPRLFVGASDLDSEDYDETIGLFAKDGN